MCITAMDDIQREGQIISVMLTELSLKPLWSSGTSMTRKGAWLKWNVASLSPGLRSSNMLLGSPLVWGRRGQRRGDKLGRESATQRMKFWQGSAQKKRVLHWEVGQAKKKQSLPCPGWRGRAQLNRASSQEPPLTSRVFWNHHNGTTKLEGLQIRPPTQPTCSCHVPDNQ
jgi:hypothetical protein